MINKEHLKQKQISLETIFTILTDSPLKYFNHLTVQKEFFDPSGPLGNLPEIYMKKNNLIKITNFYIFVEEIYKIYNEIKLNNEIDEYTIKSIENNYEKIQNLKMFHKVFLNELKKVLIK